MANAKIDLLMLERDTEKLAFETICTTFIANTNIGVALFVGFIGITFSLGAVGLQILAGSLPNMLSAMFWLIILLLVLELLFLFLLLYAVFQSRKMERDMKTHLENIMKINLKIKDEYILANIISTSRKELPARRSRAVVKSKNYWKS